MLAIDFFHRGVARYPGEILVTDDQLTITYGEMGELARKAASVLATEGVSVGERVAILSPNHPLVLACQYTIIGAGAVWVPSNYRSSAMEIARQLQTLEVSWLFFHSSLAGVVGDIRADLPLIKGWVCIDATVGDAPSFVEWASSGDANFALPATTMDDPILILTTSGTTGQPKGAVHSNRSWEPMIASFYAMLPFEERPINLVVAPLTHAAGIYTWSLLGLGGTNILAPDADPETILQLIQRHKVSVLFLPPTVIYMLLAHPNLKKYDYSSVRYFLYGAAPMSVEKLKEAIDVFGPVMVQCYGQSECLMMATILTREDHSNIISNPVLAHRISSAGREAPFCKVAIMDDAGALLAPGDRGEIVFSSQYVMQGYYKNPAATADTQANGWHRTGDVGYKDEDGYIYLVDRKNDMIISGGFNIFPGEVEQVLLGHPAVQDCAVVGIPDAKWGEAVLAAVEPKPGCTIDYDEVLAFCKARLGSVKTPKRVEIWETLPRSTVGKTLRREVRARYWVGHSRAI